MSVSSPMVRATVNVHDDNNGGGRDSAGDGDGGDDAKPLHPYLVVISAALGGFLFGYDTAIVNGGMFEMKRSFGFSDESWIAGFIVSSAVMGAVVGALLGGFLANKIGRRRTLMAGDGAFIVGAGVIAVAPDVAVVIVGRVVLGVGIGIASIVVPMYIAELTTPERRGPAVIANNVCLTGAQLIAAVVAVAFVYAEPASDNPWGWRVMFGLAAIPAAVQALLLLRMPESPAWLALSGAPAATVARAARIAGIDLPRAGGGGGAQQPWSEGETTELVGGGGGRAGVDSEGVPIVAIDASGNAVVPEAPAGLLDLLRASEHRPRVVLGVMLQVFQQVCGINTVMYYSATILQHAGYHGDKAPILFSVPLAATNALFTCVGFVTIERYGRRPLLLGSLVLCAVFLSAFSAVAFSVGGEKDPPKGAAVAFMLCLIGYLAAFAPGMGATPWVVNSEIYPLRYRSAATSVATTANWVSNAVVSQLFPVVMGWLGTGATFLILVGMCVLGFVFVWFKQPETKGMPLEEMERGLPPVRRSFLSGSSTADGDA